MKHTPREAPSGGEDSLLDVIANLVGVLIILVAIASAASHQIMARALSASTRAAASQNDEDDLQSSLQKLREQTRVAEIALHELEDEIARNEAACEQLELLRHQELVAEELARREARPASSPGGAEDRTAASRVELATLRSQLVQLNETLSARQSRARESLVLTHYPTPIARTVFTEEIHFRIARGRVCHVPVTSLVDAMKAQLRSSAPPQSHGGKVDGETGAMDGFRMVYTLDVSGTPVAGSGNLQRVTVELDRFELVADPLLTGETVDEALAPGSGFHSRLDRMKPQQTTVSLWVYPDSYREFMQLRDALRARGFQTAAWPLRDGQPIAGGRDGLRTSAQ